MSGNGMRPVHPGEILREELEMHCKCPQRPLLPRCTFRAIELRPY